LPHLPASPSLITFQSHSLAGACFHAPHLAINNPLLIRLLSHSVSKNQNNQTILFENPKFGQIFCLPFQLYILVIDKLIIDKIQHHMKDDLNIFHKS